MGQEGQLVFEPTLFGFHMVFHIATSTLQASPVRRSLRVDAEVKGI